MSTDSDMVIYEVELDRPYAYVEVEARRDISESELLELAIEELIYRTKIMSSTIREI